MDVSRWEKERSAWLLARSKPGMPRRRRAELLARRARHLGRGHASAGESAFHDDVSERLYVSLMKSDEGALDKLARVLLVNLVYGLVWLGLGGAIAIAAAIYLALWSSAPKLGRLLAWPWAAAGAVVGVAGWLLIDHEHTVGISVWPRYFVLEVDWLLLGLNWSWSQLTAGLLLTGLYIREAGWAAVPKGAAQKPAVDAKGEFIATPEHEKRRLDPFAGQPAAERPAASAPEPVVSLSSLATAEPELDDDLDEVPVFDDLDDLDFDALVEPFERNA